MNKYIIPIVAIVVVGLLPLVVISRQIAQSRRSSAGSGQA